MYLVFYDLYCIVIVLLFLAFTQVVFTGSSIHFVGLVYCMDYLEKNIDWLESKLKPLLKGCMISFVIYFHISFGVINL